MKKNTKILIFVIAIVVVIGIFAWGNLHHKNIDSLPSLEQVSSMEDEAQLKSPFFKDTAVSKEVSPCPFSLLIVHLIYTG